MSALDICNAAPNDVGSCCVVASGVVTSVRRSPHVASSSCSTRRQSRFSGLWCSRQLSLDPAKVSAAAEWPTAVSHKRLQRFLRFTNFYRCFIRDYSKVIAPLTSLTFTLKVFQWATEAEAALCWLKFLFTSAHNSVTQIRAFSDG